MGKDETSGVLDVVVFEPDRVRQGRIACALEEAGFDVQAPDTLAQVYRACAGSACRLMVLGGPEFDTCLASNRLRMLDASAGIVAIGHYRQVQARIQALQAGADICLPSDVDGRELACTLQALARRALHFPVLRHRGNAAHLEAGTQAQDGEALAAEVAAGGHWQLADRGWTLVDPLGRRVGLSTVERTWFGRLVNAPNRSLKPGEMLDEEGGQERMAASGSAPATLAARRMQVMVCRLRRKARLSSVELPVRSVRNWGYMLTAVFQG